MKVWIGVGAALAWVLAGCAAGGTSGDDKQQGDGGGPLPQQDGAADDSGDPNAEDTGVVVDTGPPPCMYPSGPYGKTQGATIAPTLQWQGYLPGSSSIQTLKATDLFDCDGRYGINAIVFDESALWCGACQQEAQQLPGWMQSPWGPEGVKFVTLIIEDASSNPATTAAALTWRNQFNLGQTVAVVADPAFTFAHSGNNGLPTNILVDPRTMKITKIVEGYGGMDPSVSALAQKNK